MEPSDEPRADLGRRDTAAVVGLLLLSGVAGTVDVADDRLHDALRVVALGAGAAFWLLLAWLAYGHWWQARRRRSRATSDHSRESMYAQSDGARRDHP